MTQPAPDDTTPPSAAVLPDDLWRDFPKTATEFSGAAGVSGDEGW